MLFHYFFFAFLVGATYTCPTDLQMQPCECEEVDSYSKRIRTKLLDVSCENAQVDQVAGALAHVAQSKRLVKVNLESTELGNLPRQLLAGLNIVVFSAEHCNLSSVDEYAFSDAIDTLERMVLNHNNLERVPTAALNKLRFLRALYLNFNRLEVLHADSLKGFHHLEVLSLRGNRLKFIDESAFEFGSQFEYIFLGQNELPAFPSRALSRPAVIKSLDIEDNKIASLQPEDFSNMTAGGSLAKLRLYNNRIRHIPPRTFSSLNKLEGLVLYGNAIESVDPLAFEGIGETLDFLSLSNNFLQEVPAESLRNMSVLEYLYLEGNSISTIREDDFEPYGRSLKYLYLRNNSLTFVHPWSLVNLHSLGTLALTNNQLNTVPYETYSHVLDTLTSFDLNGNPLHCDCKISWLKDLKRSVFQSYWVKCAWPEEYANVPLHEIPKDSLICQDSTLKPPTTHAEVSPASTLMPPTTHAFDSGHAEVSSAPSSHCTASNAFVVAMQVALRILQLKF